MKQFPILPSTAEVRASAGPNARIVFVSGNFNVIHVGHMRLLKFAADAGDIVVVGLNPDNTPGVTVPLALRMEAVQSIASVKYVIELPNGPVPEILRLKPDIVVKGKEFENAFNEEQAVVAGYGGKLLFSSGEMRFSSFDLLKREFALRESSTQNRPRDYAARRGFTVQDLRNVIERFSGLRVLVIGDLIVDEYVTCDPLGMSQEDPTIVVTPIDRKIFVGGAGVVSAHARGLGASVRFLSVAGRDKSAKFAADTLEEFGVEADIVTDLTRPTTVKARFRANGKTLLRVNDLRQHSIDIELQRKLMRRVKAWLPQTDVILFSDFNYGCLPQTLVNDMISLARSKHVMMCADSQASSQMADISRFRHQRMVTPTEREARLALHDTETGIASVASQLKAKAQSDNVVVTMGAEGMLVVGVTDGEEQLDQLPAFNSTPKDVAGAGDSFFTCASLSLCTGQDIWRSAYLGSIAAAIQVSRVGNTPIRRSELIAELAHGVI